MVSFWRRDLELVLLTYLIIVGVSEPYNLDYHNFPLFLPSVVFTNCSVRQDFLERFFPFAGARRPTEKREEDMSVVAIVHLSSVRTVGGHEHHTFPAQLAR